MKAFSREEKLLLITLALVQFTNIMDFMIMMPLGPQLMRIFSITPSQFAYLVSSYTISAGICGFLSSLWIDRFDRKSFLLFLYSGFLMGTLACALSPNFYALLFSRVLTGCFGGIIGACTYSIVGDSIAMARRGQAMGTVMTAFSLASVLGVPVGLGLANLWGWHAPFFFLVWVGMLIWVMIKKFVPSLKGHLVQKYSRESVFQVYREIFLDRNKLIALSLTATLMMGHFSIIPFLSPYLVFNVGFTEGQLTYIYFLGGSATFFTSPCVGRLSDQWGAARVFTVAAILAIIPIWIVTHLEKTAVPWVLLVTTFFFIFGNGRMVPSMALVTSAVPSRMRGAFMSVNSSLQQLSSGGAALLAGLVVVKNEQGKLMHYDQVSYLTIAASLLCIFIASKIKPSQDVRF